MTHAPGTVGDLLGRSLRALGVTRVFGSSSSGVTGIAGLGHLRVDEPHLAVLLADAHGRVSHGRRPGAALLPGRRLHLGSQPGAGAPSVGVTDAATLVEAIAAFAVATPFDAVDLELDVDLDEPAPDDVEPLVTRPAGPQPVLDPALLGLPLVLLAGPGVIGADAVEALRALAARTGIPVVETPGARGMVAGAPGPTVGLQEADTALAGLEDAAFVVTCGLDPDEEPPAGWTSRQTLAVGPHHLAALVPDGGGGPAAGPTSTVPLVEVLARVVEPAAASSASPLTPARAAAELVSLAAGASAERPALVAADAGPAGLWVCRALPTRPGGVVVPARPAPGFALAAAMVAALDDRPAVAVTVGPFDPVTRELLGLAGRVGSRLTVVEWGADVAWADAAAHRVALRQAAGAAAVAHVPVPVDLSDTRRLVEVAGPVVAWHRPAEGGFLTGG